MSERSLAFTLFFVALMASQWVVEPAYGGFLIAFVLIVLLQGYWNGIPTDLHFPLSPQFAGLFAIIVVLFLVTLANGPASRDVFRDLGALFAFFVGRQMFIGDRSEGLRAECLMALSTVGLIVSLVTVAAAVLAFSAGVSAYVWRGEYVPWAHAWLPFALVANVFLIKLRGQDATTYRLRAALCVVGTVASLSRTDLLLEIGFAMVLVYRMRRDLFPSVRGTAAFFATVGLLVAAIPFLMQLQVVQQRIDAGVGERDASIGWRLMEHLALFEHFQNGALGNTIFGFGFGARMPLPPGVLDFNGNTSIPHLHNSFATIALKFGVAGLVVLAIYLCKLYRESRQLGALPGEPYRQAGRWIVLLCLGKAITLQAMSEWAQLVFFGIGCMLMVNKPLRLRGILQLPPRAA